MSSLEGSAWRTRLLPSDRSCVLEADGWYSTSVVWAFQELLKAQRGAEAGVGNLRDPLAAQNPKYGYCYSSSSRLQIVLLRRHWFVMSFNPSTSTTHIFDSLRPRSGVVPDDVKRISDTLFQAKHIQYEQVQQQDNGHDCGVFAIVFLELLSRGLNPGSFLFPHTQLLRKQLAKMLMLNQVRPFFCIPCR